MASRYAKEKEPSKCRAWRGTPSIESESPKRIGWRIKQEERPVRNRDPAVSKSNRQARPPKQASQKNFSSARTTRCDLLSTERGSKSSRFYTAQRVEVGKDPTKSTDWHPNTFLQTEAR